MNEFLSAYGGRNKNLPQTLTLDHVSPATRLLEKRRQMFEVQEALDAQKEEVSVTLPGRPVLLLKTHHAKVIP